MAFEKGDERRVRSEGNRWFHRPHRTALMQINEARTEEIDR